MTYTLAYVGADGVTYRMDRNQGFVTGVHRALNASTTSGGRMRFVSLLVPMTGTLLS